ncbi:MAG TPA: MASE1 domain-containing protein [Xanthobacteraceae bacterium]
MVHLSIYRTRSNPAGDPQDHVAANGDCEPLTLPLPHIVQSVLLVSASYYAAGLVALLFVFPPSGISVIWLSSSILLAALLLTPPRYWWMYLLAAVPTHLLLVLNFQHPQPSLVVALCQVASNAFHAVLAALAVRLVIGAPPRFDSLRNMVAFILLAGIVATAVGSALAVLLFLLTGWVTDFLLAWWQRVLAGAFAIITIPPLIVLTYTGQLFGSQRARPRSYAELALLTIGLLAVSIPVLGWRFPGPANVPALLLAPLPLLLWAAVRLGPGALCISLLLVAGVALANGYLGRGPFAIQSSAENVLSLQIFLLSITIPLMLVAALVEERRRAEESLKQTQARMAVAAASTDTGLWQYDVPTGQLWATEHCRSMFGLNRDSLITPESFLGVVHPDDRPIAMAAMRAAAPGGQTARSGEFRVVHSNDLHWYLFTGGTEFDQDGNPIRVSGIFRDITARKKAQQEAEKLENDLQAMRRELARVSRQTTIGAMAASIAHEINQPLSALVTNGSIGLRLLAKADSDLDEVREVLKRIIDDGHRASQVVASIRAMFGKDQRDKSPVDIRDLISEVLALVHGELDSQRVSLQVELHPELPRVMADRVQLQQVLLNLIMNAVEAMSSVENRERSLLVKSDFHGKRDVLITVEDSGPGLDPKDTVRIFDAFFTTKSHGMGLGLSVCQSIIESHGGRLWASTRRPHGSVFCFQLPTGPVAE